MKKCIYPLVIYANKAEQCYLGIFPDLDISCSGDTVEEAYLDALENLQHYLHVAEKLDAEIAAPSTFEESCVLNPKRIVLLSMVEVDIDSFELAENKDNYKLFLQQQIVEG